MKTDATSAVLALGCLIATVQPLATQAFSCNRDNHDFSFASGRRTASTEFRRQQKERVEQAFQDLKDEVKNAKADGPFVDEDSSATSPFAGFAKSFFQGDEESLKLQKEWINKAFDFASGFNSEFSTTSKDAQKNEQDIEQVRDFVNKIYEARSDAVETEPLLAMYPDKKSPGYEIRNTETTFQIAMDVPGVEKSDIDISLEEDDTLLKIQGERRRSFDGDEEDSGGKFTKRFNLSQNKGLIKDNISAKLANGVLYVSIPKRVVDKDDDGSSKKIPIT